MVPSAIFPIPQKCPLALANSVGRQHAVSVALCEQLIYRINWQKSMARQESVWAKETVGSHPTRSNSDPLAFVMAAPIQCSNDMGSP
jgi:hypothetical protein